MTQYKLLIAAIWFSVVCVLASLGMIGWAAADKVTITDMTLERSHPILEILLYSKAGIPAGYVDSTTREDATEMCNALIAHQSKHYATPISKSRCIIRVAE
jgi:hypothetical protein